VVKGWMVWGLDSFLQVGLKEAIDENGDAPDFPREYLWCGETQAPEADMGTRFCGFFMEG
jgi:hypothetical protein